MTRHGLSKSLLLAAIFAAMPIVAAPPAVPPERPVNKDVRPTRAIPPVPAAREVPLDPALRQAAREEIERELAVSDPVVRAHAVEAACRGLKADGQAPIIKALTDAEGVVRFAAAMACGDLRLAEANGALLGMLNDENLHVRIAVRYALHRLGDKRYSHYLERTAIDPMPGIRGNTALVLGRMEEPSAAKLLTILQRDADPAVRLQANESLWRLGDESGLKPLVGALYSYPDDQIIALSALVAPKNQKVLGQVQASLDSDYPQVQLTAARALGELHPDMPYRYDEGYGIAMESARNQDWQQRMLAALALGAIGRSDAQDMLRTLLQTKEDSPGLEPAQHAADIRLAAAQAILELKK